VESEGSLKAKLGTDEQESDKRPAFWGNPAMDGKAQYLVGQKVGASGRSRGKDVRLTPGDL